MAAIDWKRGTLRLWLVLSALWVAGMGWHQYQEAQRDKDSSLTISLSRDSQLHIDTSGIKQESKADLQLEQMGWLFLPPVLLLIVLQGLPWLVGGFKAKEQ